MPVPEHHIDEERCLHLATTNAGNPVGVRNLTTAWPASWMWA
jgi:hypothetical protein